MAETLSAEITTQTTTPPTKNPVRNDGGRVRVKCGTFEVAAADFDADGDEIHLCRLPGNATVLSIKIGNDAMDTGSDTDSDLGISRVASDGSFSIIDENYFADALDLSGAARLTEYIDEIQTDLTEWGKTLWEIAGDGYDTGTPFDIVLFQQAAVSTALAATVVYKVEYVVD